MAMAWTDQRINKLRDGRACGLSFGVIARSLGVSRGACIGKASRLGLPAKKAVLKLDWGEAVGRRPEDTAGRRPEKERRRHGTNRRRWLRDQSSHPVAPAWDDLPDEASDQSVTIGDLRAGHCRWPVSGHGVAMLYCGAAKYGESSYCAWHHRMGHQPRRAGIDRWHANQPKRCS